MKIPKKLKDLKIKLLVLDVDGVLTDGKIYLSDDGIETKTFDIRDGLGLKILMKNGIDVAIISGRKSKAAANRMRHLGIKHVYLGVDDKMPVFTKLKAKLKLSNKNIAYIGDDIPDIEVMKKVGFSFAVADATPEAKKAADYILKNSGGNSAVREACDIIQGERNRHCERATRAWQSDRMSSRV